MTETRGSTATPERARPEKSGDGGGPIARVGLFYRQVVAELRKVIWPTRQQLITYWTVVLVFVLAIIGIVSLLDLGIGWLMLKVFG
ncbi:preprotein translocase subunit SecE [Tenggerimyces flavus]|uniref:Protein translocase subunit SecE n=1 Tax=Tenggerimyces flavus TaxID=1708749 RepID=A0ABV7YMF0_9ACTN|nr:preprotein translocase subunit SecE [Tenggerimyces flavus]MBM7785803.1 preprotein translocase subunit SecE [Tenggerimyces flavus]